MTVTAQGVEVAAGRFQEDLSMDLDDPHPWTILGSNT